MSQDAALSEELWRHSDPKSTSMWRFMQQVNQSHRLKLIEYHELHKWSVDNVDKFWDLVWRFCGIKASRNYAEVVDIAATMFPRPPFFSGALINFAENLLFPAGVTIDATGPAIIAATEISRSEITWDDLREAVRVCQAGLVALGIKQGDRIAGYVGNHINAIVAMLATTSIGAIWTAVSPDSGVSMVLDRLQQIEPVLLFSDSEQYYNGKTFDVLSKVAEIAKKLSSLKNVVIMPPSEDEKVVDLTLAHARTLSYRDMKRLGSDEPLKFEQLPPDHPVYILYSSGTTGLPKVIVHGAIGTLIQHKKEHIIHCSVEAGQRFFYFTTVTWMMWHWLVSGLASGATLILYDGSPMRYMSQDKKGTSLADDLAMPRLIAELKVNHFGTSAKYLSILEQKDIQPKKAGIDLTSLQAIYNTASPLAPSTFRYIYKAFGPDINLASITGGTDIVSLFGAACPITPVYAGEVQVPGLGMAIRAFSDEGKDVTNSGEAGDLVCIRAFPCQPIAFWPVNSKEGLNRYRSSYFERFVDVEDTTKAVWHHGDYVAFNQQTGGLIMLGRSDGVLNPAGVRFGSAEIYNVLLKNFAGVIHDGLCIGRRREAKGDSDETVVLFVKMEKPKSLDEKLIKEIKTAIRQDLSARHVPGIVDECPDIPVTVNGKKVEGVVKQIISGSKVKTSASVANSECLEFYREWASDHD